MVIRLIILDLDGTLLDPLGVISPRVHQAVQDAIREGFLVTLATGRRFPSAKRVAESLGVRSPLIVHGGAIIQDSETGEVLYEHLLQQTAYLRILDIIEASALQPMVFQSPAVGGDILTGPEKLDTEETKRYLQTLRAYRRRNFDELRAADHNLSVSVMADEPPLSKLHSELALLDSCNPQFNPPSVHPRLPWHTVDILPDGCNKTRAISFYADSLGIPLTEVMAIGDHINDMDMIEAVGWGVAMGNAVPELQAAAKAIVRSNADDGVAEAIERFVLRR